MNAKMDVLAVIEVVAGLIDLQKNTNKYEKNTRLLYNVNIKFIT